MKISIIGLGYVGLPLSSLLARNYKVVGFDVDSNKVAMICRGEFPIKEPELAEALSSALNSGNLLISQNVSMLWETNVKIITVGTPYDGISDSVDYSQLKGSLDIIIPLLKKGDVVILKSTVPPGTTMGIVRKRIEESGLVVPSDVGLVFSPERIIEGQAIRDFQTLPKIIGASDHRSAAVAKDVMASLGGKIVTVSTPETAEMAKMVDNYSRYVFLGLTNELALACEKIGVDVLEVIRSAKEEYPRNAGLLLPGPGVGGSCLNKDPFILRGVIRKSGMEMQMLKSADAVNSSMPGHVIDLVLKYRKSGEVTLLGVAFKGDTDDTRFSPATTIRDGLTRVGFGVKMTDPFVIGESIVSDLYEACTKSDVTVLLTDHSEYRSINLSKMKSVMGPGPLIIDTRGMISRDEAVRIGFEYHGIGRL
jgi:UDP-N-acetyl-D-mannosaminuronic acid dehydrogenase